MYSSEISDLESFIDSYVTSDKGGNSPRQWSRTQSHEDGYPANKLQQFNEQHAMPQNTGTEIWGQKQGGNEWHAPSFNKPHGEQNEHRPKIQERSVQWQQPAFQAQQNYKPHIDGGHFQNHQQAQDPNHIQAIVSGLIRQNNMNKAPDNVPNWVDVTRPPPPFRNAANPPFGQVRNDPNFPNPPFGQVPNDPNFANPPFGQVHNDPNFANPPFGQVPNDPNFANPPFGQVPNDPNFANPPFGQVPNDPNFANPPFGQVQNDPNLYHNPQQNFPGQEPILQSMTFQRQDIPLPGAQINRPPQPVQPAGMVEPWGATDYNPGIFYQQIDENSRPQFYNQPVPAVNNYQQYQKEPEQLDFHSEVMQGGHYEATNLPARANQIEPSKSNNLPPQYDLAEPKPTLPEDRQYVSSTAHSLPKENHSETGQAQSKYPNSKFRSSRGSTDDDSKDKETIKQTYYQRQNSEDVFENEHDEKWKTQSHNIQVQINNKKKTVQRKSSAADEDTDWRRRSRSDSANSKKFEPHNSTRSVENEYRGQRSNHSRNERRERREISDSDATTETKTLPLNKASKAGEKITSQQRHLTDKRLGNVLSWLQNEQPHAADPIGKEIRKLKITDSEADLSKFIEMTQSFATNEAKMREVAEIICNKALKEPMFCRNASLLCDRMSFMMVQGTKFRSVVLNVMQGHYKNREQLYASSYRRDRRWFGFVTFLIEIFLNVRTSTKDRLLVLSTPVFNSMFQVLVGTQIDQEHIECFARLFQRVGPGLEAENLSRLNELMAEIRDRCVMSKAAYVKRALLSCVELYASKWSARSIEN